MKISGFPSLPPLYEMYARLGRSDDQAEQSSAQ